MYDDPHSRVPTQRKLENSRRRRWYWPFGQTNQVVVKPALSWRDWLKSFGRRGEGAEWTDLGSDGKATPAANEWMILEDVV